VYEEAPGFRLVPRVVTPTQARGDGLAGAGLPGGGRDAAGLRSHVSAGQGRAALGRTGRGLGGQVPAGCDAMRTRARCIAVCYVLVISMLR